MVLAVVRKVPYFLEAVKNKTKFHITIGHQTAIGTCLFFTVNDPAKALALGMELEAKAFNRAALNSSVDKVIMNIDVEHYDYCFTEEIKASKLTKQASPQQEEEKKQAPDSGLPVYYAAIKLEKEVFV
jgi:hypothetical protein